jgi:hypothetical protein
MKMYPAMGTSDPASGHGHMQKAYRIGTIVADLDDHTSKSGRKPIPL